MDQIRAPVNRISKPSIKRELKPPEFVRAKKLSAAVQSVEFTGVVEDGLWGVEDIMARKDREIADGVEAIIRRLDRIDGKLHLSVIGTLNLLVEPLRSAVPLSLEKSFELGAAKGRGRGRGGRGGGCGGRGGGCGGRRGGG